MLNLIFAILAHSFIIFFIKLLHLYNHKKIACSYVIVPVMKNEVILVAIKVVFYRFEVNHQFVREISHRKVESKSWGAVMLCCCKRNAQASVFHMIEPTMWTDKRLRCGSCRYCVSMSRRLLTWLSLYPPQRGRYRSL